MEGIRLDKLNESIEHLQRQRATAHRLGDYKIEELYRLQLEKKCGLRDLLLNSLEEKVI